MGDCRKRHCEFCGLTPCVGVDRCPQWDHDDLIDDYHDGLDGWWESQVIGSCDECEANLYRGESYGGLCSRCAWLAQMSRDEDDGREEDGSADPWDDDPFGEGWS